MFYDCTPPIALPSSPSAMVDGALPPESIPPTPSFLLPGLPGSITSFVEVDDPALLSLSRTPLDDSPLDALIGPARVLDVPSRSFGSEGELLSNVLGSPEDLLPPRVILRFAGVVPSRVDLSASLLHALAERGVRVVGSNVTLATRQPSRGLIRIDGLELDNVEPGDYVLVALPLRVPGATRVPARVILKTVD